MNERDQRRRFSRRERTVLFIAFGGKSATGSELDRDWQADHVWPWSRGGCTDLVNAQPLNAGENRRKADRR
jgi:hypothetical protein